MKNKDILIFIISIILFIVTSITMISAFSILKIYLAQPQINKIKYEKNSEKTFSGDPLITPASKIEN
ncbi:MAG: hypothetical protein U9O55_04550 [Patescibacteria group bacterium]|nr:hypothetical protein [Patescibacteria group bacterium]